MTTFAFRPLYRQVKDEMVRRIADGVWAGGAMLPSETEIARELGVSQGTVRKALDEMTAENLLIRRQGVGTFVASHDEARILFQFFKLTPDDGARVFPESRVVGVERRPSDTLEATRLALAPGAAVLAIRRIRLLNGQPVIVERIAIPGHLVPDLEHAEVPNNLYALYASRYGVTIARATERLKAVAAVATDAASLDVPVDSPLLSVDRVAYALDGAVAEWRLSHCRTDTLHYLSELK